MAIISKPGSALVFLQPVLTSRRIKIPFNSHSKNMAPFGSPAGRVVEPYVAKRQAAKRHRTPSGFVRERFRSDG